MKSCLLILAMAGCGALTVAVESAEKSSETRVLILTGEDYPGHAWKETTPVLKGQLCRDPRLKVDVESDLTRLGAKDLTGYQAVVMHFKNYDANIPGREGFERLDAYVRGGGGLVLAHFACGAFQEFKPDFAPIAGRVWFGLPAPPGRHQHDPYGRFVVSIADREHPITRKLKNFETVDELYTCLEGAAPIRTLATAVSTVDGKTYPMAFVLPAGKGRVFHCVLGHDAQALGAEGPGQLYRRGTAWVAGLDPDARECRHPHTRSLHE